MKISSLYNISFTSNQQKTPRWFKVFIDAQNDGRVTTLSPKDSADFDRTLEKGYAEIGQEADIKFRISLGNVIGKVAKNLDR